MIGRSLEYSTNRWQFIENAMSVDPTEKLISPGRIEKYILRKAFDTSNEPDAQPYLPEHILWRQKEQFSDGVGYGWIDALKDSAELHVSDEQMKHPKAEWGDDRPDTKEAYWYRLIFDELFPPQCASTVMRWTPTWSKQTDPSGRQVAVKTYSFGFPLTMALELYLRIWPNMRARQSDPDHCYSPYAATGSI